MILQLPMIKLTLLSRISKDLINADNEIFVNKMHNYFDNWDSIEQT